MKNMKVLGMLITALVLLYSSLAMAQENVMNLPQNTKQIKTGAFYGLMGIDTVVLPEGVEEIQSFAFAQSTILSINLPASLSYIAEDAFDGCSDEVIFTVEPNSYALTWCEEQSYRYRIHVEYSPKSDFSYSRSNGVATINGYIGNEKYVYIPNEIDGYPVVNINRNAFKNCTSIVSVTIPDSVSYIGDNAFLLCKNLERIDIPDSVTYIGSNIFDRCVSLREANIPTGLSSVPVGMFWECISLEYIDIPENITNIGNSAFYGCTNLESINLPEAVNRIGGSAFARCERLTSIVIPDNVTEIGQDAFSYCISLESIKMPDGVKRISEGLFCECKNLNSVIMPEGVTIIDGWAFQECANLANIDLPDSLMEIGSYAFDSCSGLGVIQIPNGVKSIGNYAFRDCVALSGNLIIPDSVENIGKGAFSGCIGFTGNLILSELLTIIGARAFYNCYELTGNLNLPESLKEIGDEAFAYCSKLSGDLVLPNSLERIGDYAFRGCRGIGPSIVLSDNLTSISAGCFRTCYSIEAVYGKSISLIGTDAFLSCDRLSTIYVSKELEEGSSYRTDPRICYIDFKNKQLLDKNGNRIEISPEIRLIVEKNDNDNFDGKVTYDVTLSIRYDYDDIMDLIREDIEFETVKVNNPGITVITPDYIAEEYTLNPYQKQTLTVDGEGHSKVQCEQVGYFGDEFTFKVTFMSEVVQNDPANVRFVFSSDDDYTVEDAEISIVFPKVYDAETTYFADYTFSNEYASVNGNMAIQEGTTIITDESQVKVQGELYISGGTLEIQSGYLRCSRLVISDGGTLRVNGGSITAYDSSSVRDDGILEMHGGSLVSYGLVFDSQVDHTGKLTGGFMNIVGDAALGKNFHASGDHAFRISGAGTMDVDERASLASVQIVSDVLDFTLTRAFECVSFCFSKSTLGKMADDATQIVEALKYALNAETVEQADKSGNEEMYALQMGYLCAVPLGTAEATKEAWMQSAQKALSIYTAELMAETNEYKISTMQGLSTILYQTTKQKTYTVSDYTLTIKPIAGLKLSSAISGAGVIDLYNGQEQVMDFVYSPNEAGMESAVEEYIKLTQNELYAVFKKEFNNALTDGIPGGKYLNTLLGMCEDSVFSEEKLKATLKNYAAGRVDEAVLSRLPNFKKFSSFYSQYRSAFVDANQIASGKYDGGTSMKVFLDAVAALVKLIN